MSKPAAKANKTVTKKSASGTGKGGNSSSKVSAKSKPAARSSQTENGLTEEISSNCASSNCSTAEPTTIIHYHYNNTAGQNMEEVGS